MYDRTITHAEFELERIYSASRAEVFAAFADREAKQEWFAGASPDGGMEYELDFRVGGRELNRMVAADGPARMIVALYHDIVQNERIVYSYEVNDGDHRVSVSLTTIEFLPEDEGTHLIYTESGVFLDGLDKPEWREEATNNLLDALGAALGGMMWDE